MKLARVQILRFVAAAAVVVFHSAGTLSHYMPFPIPRLIAHGDLGVDLFFVISGFIIHRTARTREQEWRLFLYRRVSRVVPLYWLCTVGTFVLSQIPGLARDAPSLSYLARSLTFVAWSEAPGRMPVLFPGWSLEYEMMFYLVATAALALSVAPWRHVCFTLAALVTLGVTTGAVTGIPPETTRLGFFVNPMLLEFCFGILVAAALERRRVPRAALAAVVVATAALLAGPLDTAWRVFAAGLPAAILVGGAAMLDERQALRSAAARAIAHLGDATYSIYLVHALAISALCKLVRILPTMPPLLLVAIIAAAAIIAGYLVYRLVELPLLRLTHRHRPKPTPVASTGAAA